MRLSPRPRGREKGPGGTTVSRFGERQMREAEGPVAKAAQDREAARDMAARHKVAMVDAMPG